MRGGLILLAGSLLGIGRMSLASTPEAWAEFEDSVRTASEALIAGQAVSMTDIFVVPFGSESYGIALVHGLDNSTSVEVVYVTVYDKTTGDTEMSGEIPLSEMDWWRRLTDENRRLRIALEAIKTRSR
jgi:hypothetical protein